MFSLYDVIYGLVLDFDTTLKYESWLVFRLFLVSVLYFCSWFLFLVSVVDCCEELFSRLEMVACR